MKRITTILLIVLALASCTKYNDDVVNTELEGNWILTNATCFCGFGENTDFSTHKVTFEGSALSIENYGDNKFLTDATGSYIVQGNMITIESGAQYTYVVKEDKLELTFVDNSEVADDELFLEYLKN